MLTLHTDMFNVATEGDRPHRDHTGEHDGEKRKRKMMSGWNGIQETGGTLLRLTTRWGRDVDVPATFTKHTGTNFPACV